MRGIEIIWQLFEIAFWAGFWLVGFWVAVQVYRFMDGPFKVWLATDAQRRVTRKRHRS